MKTVFQFLYRVCRGVTVFTMISLFMGWCLLVVHKKPFMFPLNLLTHTLPKLAVAYGVFYACVTELWQDWKGKHA